MPSKPGAQPRNTNALKHGFYSSRSSTIEWDDLSGRSTDSLAGEIDALRVLLHRLACHPDPDPDPLDTDPYNPFNVIITASARLSSLIRTQYRLAAPDNDAWVLLHHAVKEYWLKFNQRVYQELLTPENLESLRLKLRSAR